MSGENPKRELAPSLKQLVSGRREKRKKGEKKKNDNILKENSLAWFCKICQNPCLLCTPESRCLCGHRLREHKYVGKRSSCGVYKCRCRCFFYIVAQGSFILRCRCKHKHTDHDASKKERNCTKRNCECQKFDSPFVCNCTHGWKDHVQKFIPKVVRRNILPEGIGDPTAVKRGIREEEEKED